MLDIRIVRDDPERVQEAAKDKHVEISVERIVDLDGAVRESIHQIDLLRAEKNQLSGQLARGKAHGEENITVRHQVREINARIKELEDKTRPIREELDGMLLWLPNLPHVSAPVGSNPEENIEIRRYGVHPQFGFDPAPHWDLASALGILDQERAPRLAGSNFALFAGTGARLVRGLMNFMLDIHVKEHGYTEYWPPLVALRQNMLGTGQLPKLEDDMYACSDSDLFLIPTGEVPLTNIHRGDVVGIDQLPRRLVAFTSCFRREAGAYGKDTRGLNRIHQFDKVELVRIVEPERSYEELESLVADAEEVLQRLELPYRVISLCRGELSFAAAKCYDLEVWAAGQKRWLEVSSCSNFEDFQARRIGLRYRPEAGKKPRFTHTLNGSALAFPRVIAALLENNQTEDGAVRLPKSLQPYMDGMETITLSS